MADFAQVQTIIESHVMTALRSMHTTGQPRLAINYK